MKYIAILILITTAFSYNRFFCDGYRIGYKDGYCYEKAFCVPPIPPVCPVPAIGEKSFKDGYRRGIAEGLRSR
jgi:hypothetical protein